MKKHWLCRIGLHNRTPVYTGKIWLGHKEIDYWKCSRCGKKHKTEYAQWDGTDNA